MSKFKKLFLIVLYKSRIISISVVKLKIRINHRKHFRLVPKLVSLGKEYIEKTSWNYGEFEFFTVNLLAQNLHRLKSIVLLLKNGLSADAWGLFRTLIENTLDYEYIAKNPEKLELYFQYSIYLDLERIKRRSKITALTEEQHKQLKKLEDDWAKYENKFIKNGRVRNAWRDKSLYSLAKDAKMEDFYLMAYSEANDYVHGNSNLIRTSTLGKNNKGILLKVGSFYNEYEVYLILAESLTLFLHMLFMAEKNFKLGLTEELKSMREKIVKV